MKKRLPASLPAVPVTGVWFRAMNLRYMATAMHVGHTRTIPGRFNPGISGSPSFPALYLCEDAAIAQFEANFLVGSAYSGGVYLSNPYSSWSLLSVTVSLREVVDLTIKSNVVAIGSTIQELTGDWPGYRVRATLRGMPIGPVWAPTQKLGDHLNASGYEGAIVYSAKNSSRRNLVVFLDNLRPTSTITWFNPVTKSTESPVF